MEQGRGQQDPDAATRAYESRQTGYGPYADPRQQAGPYGPYGPPPGPQTGAAPYGYPYGYPYPPPRQSTNTLAILALVFAFVCAPAAIVMGALARRQIRRTREEGWGLATAGLVLGIVFTAISVIWIVAALTIFVHAVHDINRQNGVNGQSLALALAGARAYLGI